MCSGVRVWLTQSHCKYRLFCHVRLREAPNLGVRETASRPIRLASLALNPVSQFRHIAIPCGKLPEISLQA